MLRHFPLPTLLAGVLLALPGLASASERGAPQVRDAAARGAATSPAPVATVEGERAMPADNGRAAVSFDFVQGAGPPAIPTDLMLRIAVDQAIGRLLAEPPAERLSLLPPAFSLGAMDDENNEFTALTGDAMPSEADAVGAVPATGGSAASASAQVRDRAAIARLTAAWIALELIGRQHGIGGSR